MDLIWSLLYCAAMGGFVWLLHKGIGNYPPPLPRSEHPRRERWGALGLWSLAVSVSILRMAFLDPALAQAIPERSWREVALVPLLSLPYLALPLWVMLKMDGRRVADLGLGWHSQSRGVSLAAVTFGLVSGVTAALSSQTVMGADVLPVGVLLLLVYNNSFLEEFLHRGVILAKLERALGPRRAILWGGFLFGLTHLVFDFRQLYASQGLPAVFFALLLQTLGGWLLGIVFVKTRSLWPGVICHYLVNWLPGILAGLLR